MVNRAETNSDGIPLAEIREITDRIDIMDDEAMVDVELNDGDLARILASFENDLMQLNSKLKTEASGNIQSLRRECKVTKREVAGLNSALDEQCKGHS